MTDAEKITEIWSMIRPFTMQMRLRMTLKKNLRKTHWSQLSRLDFIDLLDIQSRQLFTAMAKEEACTVVQARAVDVANVAMLIADAYAREEHT